MASRLEIARYPQDDDELWEFTATIFGVKIPRVQVCPHHVAPFTAYADAYFARSPVAVWQASRGLSGKSYTLATLALMEQVTLGAGVSVLGGSGAQSKNVNRYIRQLWSRPRAPRHLSTDGAIQALLTRGEPGAYETTLANGGYCQALMASQRSVRSPHPHRLRLDEVDEMPLDIFESAMGQPMEGQEKIPSQTVISSTHQYPDGTMTEVKKRAAARGWSYWEWCYKECLEPHGWLSREQVAQKRGEVTLLRWQVEYDQQAPSAEGRVFTPAHITRAFDPALGIGEGAEGEYLEFEGPAPLGAYATGIDWGRKAHWSVIVTYRVDTLPWRLVAFERLGRTEWGPILARANARIQRFPGAAAHDETGVGDAHSENVPGAEPVLLTSARRQAMFVAYQIALQQGDLVAPDIRYMRDEHAFCTRKDLEGEGHPPDSFVAGAVAWHMRDRVAVGYAPETAGARSAYEPDWQPAGVGSRVAWRGW